MYDNPEAKTTTYLNRGIVLWTMRKYKWVTHNNYFVVSFFFDFVILLPVKRRIEELLVLLTTLVLLIIEVVSVASDFVLSASRSLCLFSTNFFPDSTNISRNSRNVSCNKKAKSSENFEYFPME